MNSRASLSGTAIQYCNARVVGERDLLVRRALPDSTIVYSDGYDRLVRFEYSNGAAVLRREDTVFVSSADGSHWLGDPNKGWFRLN